MNQNDPFGIEADAIPNDALVNILTQIEEENKNVPQAATSTVNVQQNVSNQINYMPTLLGLYFPNSNVTINYQFYGNK